MEEMNPGEELDALIAEKVMGWKFHSYELAAVPAGEIDLRPGCLNYSSPKTITGWTDTDGSLQELPYFSTDIAAAWEVVQKMRSYGFFYCVGNLSGIGLVESDAAGFGHCHTQFDTVLGESAPHAICLGALAAVSPNPAPSDHTP